MSRTLGGECKSGCESDREESALCGRALEEEANGSANTEEPILPADARAATNWLLYEAWERRLVDCWLAEHPGDYNYHRRITLITAKG